MLHNFFRQSFSDRSWFFHTIWIDFKFRQVQYVPYADMGELIACKKKDVLHCVTANRGKLIGKYSGASETGGVCQPVSTDYCFWQWCQRRRTPRISQFKAINIKSLLLHVTVHLESCFSSPALHSCIIFLPETPFTIVGTMRSITLEF